MEPKNNIPKAFFISLLHHMLLFSINLLFIPHVSTATRLGNETDRLALLEFKKQITNDPLRIFNSWNDSQHHCNWQGVTCSRRHQRIIDLKLPGLGISGYISPHIGNMTFLRFINIQNNSFFGEIPKEIHRLFRLRGLGLGNNTLEGAIPVNLSHCSDLRVIRLSWNKLVGKIPEDISSLKKLRVIGLTANNLTGSIPNSFGNLSSLGELSLANNKLDGSIPVEIGQLTNLTFLQISENHLGGMIPQSLYNISSITHFSAARNQFNGSLPVNIGLTLPRLQLFFIGGNQLFGTIPESFTNASQLELLDLSFSNFTGQIPINLGNLQNLLLLNIEFNFLGTNTSGDLSFITSLSNCSNLETLSLLENNFGGELPNSIGKFSHQLVELFLGYNQISGIIPPGLGNLSNLFLLGMENNLLTGAISNSLGKLQELQVLELYGNRLSGKIPSSLGNLTQLYSLNLSNNRLEGNIPSSIGNCRNLKELDMSQNNLIGIIPKEVLSISSLQYLELSKNLLNGSLPQEVGELKNINWLDISDNKLSGEIPGTLGDCLLLESLNMQGNFFEGNIPSTLAPLKGIQKLDLSRNNLSRQIPKDLENLPFLQYLNLSFNDLEGEVPTKRVFSNASTISVVGNYKLCGGIPELQLPLCPINVKKKQIPQLFKIAIIVVVTVLISISLTFSGVLFWRRNKRKITSSETATLEKGILRISYQDLYNATAGFSSENLIGSGSFGSVYRGRLQQHEERMVAIKVLQLEESRASKSFMAECIALRNIRHRNLVKILTYCSSIDYKGNDFKALVYEYMSNGSLDTWLHQEIANSSRTLNHLQRLNIAIDIASALHYLHNDCETPIIHCDLKPSNILLDSDMCAHVSDFGLARLLPERTSNYLQQQSSSIGIKGSIGFAAPEYGTGSKASTYGDVYSYGILLLEMFTGRSPTDDVFKDGLNIHNYVEMALPRQVVRIIDPMLLANEGEAERTVASVEEQDTNDEIETEEDNQNSPSLELEKCLVSVLEIGLSCSAELPKHRMDMNTVLRKLHFTRGAFLGGRSTEANHTSHT